MAEKEPTNWAPVAGRWSFKEKRITYDGPEPNSNVPFGVCLTNLRLREGTVSCRVQFKESLSEGRILLGYRSLNEKYIMAGLGGWGRAYTVGEHVPAYGWRGLALAGTADNLLPNRWYSQSIELNGQRVQLSVDTVRVLQHVFEEPATSGQTGLFAFGNAAVEFDDFIVDSRPGKVFVIMEFCEPYQQLYEEVIQPVAASFHLRAYHVGEVFGPSIILQDIAQGIVEAEVVIAEITPANENVFYELGYSHALNKPTILLAERGKELPFDVSGYRVLFYDNTIAGKKQIEEGLRKHLEAILRE
jgi:hypothetical protein